MASDADNTPEQINTRDTAEPKLDPLAVNMSGDVPSIDVAPLYEYLTELAESYPSVSGETTALRHARREIMRTVREALER